ncbi:HWE histidine kinase domain-containing protein [Sphingomicrobium sediminis]|uniref:histidine kinase n=1 Tax=Sphingomicrobium sediminis TaxID=2950949 RepID=A0A9X2ELD3_9SPHN|nr:HWE histidine kinase domain-containing protein [Sphingomicrobium sediminis]MCM8557582.1 PAS domain S-box protein [Sphingomicrobium sediminis]
MVENEIQDAAAQLIALKASLEKSEADRAIELRSHRAKVSQLEAMLDIVPVGVVVTDAGGQIVHGNAHMERMVRHPIFMSEGVDEYGEWVSFHADGRQVASQEYPLARVIAGEERAELDVHYQRGDGTKFWMKIIGSPILNDDGQRTGAVVACVDIDTEVQLREKQKILIAELNHRVKNAFSVTKAIVARSLRNAEVEAEITGTIDNRLAAYAAAHSKLIGNDWSRAPFEDVARDVLDPICGERIRYEGPLAQLQTRQAISFSMAFYELATNAVKYGSLSVEGGEVLLNWDKVHVDGREQLHIDWIERGGPQPSATKGKGFGSFVTSKALVAETGGAVQTSYEPEGFEWHFQLPLLSEEEAASD